MRNMFRVILWGLALLLSCLPNAGANEREDRLPPRWKAWLKEEVTYIITDVEREAFLELESESERDAFETAFWRHRDTKPSTPENEFKDEHYERLAYANEFLGRDTFRPGWMTDRGRYHILLGPPNTVQNFDHDDSVYPVELWFYNDSRLKEYGLPPYFYLLFFRRNGGGELELYSPATDGPQELLTGYQTVSMDRRDDVEAAYNRLFNVHPELAHAALSFRTDEADTATFSAPSFGTVALIDDIIKSPFRGVDTSYAERLGLERGLVESDFLFAFVPSHGDATVFPGPGGALFVHWVIELDPQYVAVVQDIDRNLYGTVFITSIELASGENPEQVLVQSRHESFLRMTERDVSKGGLSGPYAFRGMVPVVPGRYELRVILRNRACPTRDESECIKSYTVLDNEIEVPEHGEIEEGLSDLLLAYAVERTADRDRPLYRPFRFGAVELHPNPQAAFALGEPLIAVVEPIAAKPRSRVRFRVFGDTDTDTDTRGDAILLESVVSADRLGTEPVLAQLSLDSLDPDYYRIEAELIGPSGEVVASRSRSFTLTPRTRVQRPSVRGAAPSIAPELPGAVDMALGDQYFRLEQRKEARERYEAALAANPKLAPAIEAVAAMAMEDGDTARVIELLSPLYREVEQRYVVLALLGQAYFHEKNFASAIEVLDKAIVLERPGTQILNALGVSYHEVGDVEKARSLLERSLELDPSQPGIEQLLETIS